MDHERYSPYTRGALEENTTDWVGVHVGKKSEQYIINLQDEHQLHNCRYSAFEVLYTQEQGGYWIVLELREWVGTFTWSKISMMDLDSAGSGLHLEMRASIISEIQSGEGNLWLQSYDNRQTDRKSTRTTLIRRPIRWESPYRWMES